MTRSISQMRKKSEVQKPCNFFQFEKLMLQLSQELCYGDNYEQCAAAYMQSAESSPNLTIVKRGKGAMSATNLADVLHGMNILKYFEKPSAVIMKRASPTSFAVQFGEESLSETYLKARNANPESAFGSTVILNRKVDLATANELVSTFIYQVAAPGYAPEAVELISGLKKKEALRIIAYDGIEHIPKFAGDKVNSPDVRSLPGGMVIVQEPYLTRVRKPEDIVFDAIPNNKQDYEIGRKPSNEELEDLLTAWYVCIGVRSNGVVFVRNGIAISITSAENRYYAVKNAIVKAYEIQMSKEGIKQDPLAGASQRYDLETNPLEGAVMASDGFFPFRDSIDLLAKVGVSAVIQPGGSKRDKEIIKVASKYKMALGFTLDRCFRH